MDMAVTTHHVSASTSTIQAVSNNKQTHYLTDGSPMLANGLHWGKTRESLLPICFLPIKPSRAEISIVHVKPSLVHTEFL